MELLFEMKNATDQPKKISSLSERTVEEQFPITTCWEIRRIIRRNVVVTGVPTAIEGQSLTFVKVAEL